MGQPGKAGRVDDVKWHLGGDSEGATRENAATHIGMFLAWAIARGLASPRHYDRRSVWVRRLAAKAVTPGRYFLRTCGGPLGRSEFSPDGWRFAKATYDDYLDDFGCMFADPASPTSPYDVPDAWEVYEEIAEELDAYLGDWKS